jgi:hypothetical protein
VSKIVSSPKDEDMAVPFEILVVVFFVAFASMPHLLHLTGENHLKDLQSRQATFFLFRSFSNALSVYGRKPHCALI